MGQNRNPVRLSDVPVDGFWSITMYDKDGYTRQRLISSDILVRLGKELRASAGQTS